jgi:hypothetical protein
MSGIYGSSLNSYYHLLAYTDIPLNVFFRITLKTALSLIPKEIYGLPIFIIIDDTMQAKFGTKFECHQKMFDHAKRNESKYLNGHCFVALTISVPIIIEGSIRYLNIPVGFRLRGEKENKLKIASKMIDNAMLILADYPMSILLCDSWYPKGDILETVKHYKNLNLIANVRIDTCMFELPPPRTGKPGAPRKRGKKLSIYEDFHFIRIDEYYISVKQVLTNLFNVPVYVTVTTPNLLNHKAYRVFISTLMPADISKQFKGNEKKLSNSLLSQLPWLLPLFLYSYRWAIEVCFYELKTFWSFGLYMLRSKKGIENLVNMLAMSYASMKILPVLDPKYSSFVNESAQTAKCVFGDAIKQELFLWRFVSNSESEINSHEIFTVLSELAPPGKGTVVHLQDAVHHFTGNRLNARTCTRKQAVILRKLDSSTHKKLNGHSKASQCRENHRIAAN